MGDETPKDVVVIGDGVPGPSRLGVGDNNEESSGEDTPDDPGGAEKTKTLAIPSMEERLRTQMKQGLAGAVVELKKFMTESIASQFMQVEAQTQGGPPGGRKTPQAYSRSIKASRSESDSGTDIEDRDASGERPAKRFAHPRYITSYEHRTLPQQGERASPVPSQQGERASPEPDARAGLSETSKAEKKTITNDEFVFAVERITTNMDRPKAPLPTFSGESKREFGLFLKLFRQYLNSTYVKPAARLNMLISACTGPLSKTLLSFVALDDSEEGFERAMKMLTNRLGNSEDHIDAAMREILQGPEIEDNNSQTIEQLVNQLWDCATDLDIAGRLADLDNFGSITSIAYRFTGKLRKRYNKALREYILARHKRSRPGIEWLRDFLTQYEKEMHDDDKSGQREKEEESKPTQKSNKLGANKMAVDDMPCKERAMGLVTADKETSGSQDRTNKKWLPCILCNNHHPLYACKRFRGMSVTERWAVVKRAQVCYGCLGPSHIKRECRSPYKICGIKGCSQQHSRWLHQPEQQQGRETLRIVKLYDSDAPAGTTKAIKPRDADA